MSKHLFWILLIFVFAGCSHDKAKKTHLESVLPSLYLAIQPEELDSILHNRNYKASAEALFLSDEGDTIYDGELLYIKTRGNSTLKKEKKPFAIKFPNKMRLFGLSKNRSFVLLANAYDESHIRNAIGLDLARAMGISASRYAYLRLYINNNYQGLYQITNKVEVGKQTLNIRDLDKLNEQVNPHPLNEYALFDCADAKKYSQRKGVSLECNPADITGGYLLDAGTMGRYDISISGFVSEAGDPIRIRSPKRASKEEVEYIEELYNQMEKAVLAHDGCNPQTGKHYSEYIDVESFVHYYLLNEILMNYDGGCSSFMMYKDADFIDPKIYAGPAWDYDRILWNAAFGKTFIIIPNELYVCCERIREDGLHSGGLLYRLMQHDDFQDSVKCCYNKEIGPICHDYLERGYWDSLVENLYSEAERDNQVYKYRDSKDYETAVSRAIDFLSNRIEFFDWFFSTEESERVKVTITKLNNNKVFAYYPLGTAVYTPQTELQNNGSPVCELYYEGTDHLVKDGTVFNTSQNLELRLREPNRREVLMRRIRRKLLK